MELLDAWVLRNDSIAHPYPDAVYFEIEPLPTGKKMYCLTQFSSASCYDPSVPTNITRPVCVVRSSDPEVVRRIWNAMIERGWKRLPSGTAIECSVAAEGIRAKRYRQLISIIPPITENGVEYTGRFSDPDTESDHRSTVYFPNNFSHTKIVLRHPITQMPIHGKPVHKWDWSTLQKQSYKKTHNNILKNSIPQHFEPRNTQYALEA